MNRRILKGASGKTVRLLSKARVPTSEKQPSNTGKRQQAEIQLLPHDTITP